MNKITLKLNSLHKKLTKAKHIHEKTKQMSLHELRQQLINNKLIRPNSTAPESILRQIAADTQILSTKTL